MMIRTLAGLIATSALLTGCFFLEDGNGDTRERIRGYTYCGEFALEEVYCSPGQYCEDTTFSICTQGCLSDVNCASNQYCDINGQGQTGTCRNELESTARALEADVGIGADAGYGGDAGR